MEKISADKDCAIDGLESSVKSIRGSCETLSKTVAEHERISKLHSHQQSVEIISTKHDLVRVESNLRSVKNDVQHLISGSNDFKSSAMSASIDIPEPSSITEVKERYKGNEAALNKYIVTFEKQQQEFEEMRRRLANIEQSREHFTEVPVEKRYDDKEPDDIHKSMDGETFVKSRLTQNVPVNFTPNPHGRRSHSVHYSTPRDTVHGKNQRETARVNAASAYPRYSSQVSHHSRQHRSPDSSGDSGDRSRRSYVSQDRSRPNRHSTHMPLPKLSFEGEHWIGFITQFELVAKNFDWSEAEKLANFAMSLKKGAAEFYSILSTMKEQDYEWLKNKFQHHYGGTDSATTIRYELLQTEQKEDESLEEYLARLQKMVVASFPDESKREACSPFFVDAFMKGCRNKGAVLSAAEKHPKTLEEAYKYVLDATHLRKAILGKKHVKKVKPVEADNRMETESLTSTSSSDSREIRGYHVKTGRFERKRFDRSDKSDDQLRSVLTGLQKILRRSEPHSPNKHNYSPPRQGYSGCFECGDPDHFVRDCPRRRRYQNYDDRRYDERQYNGSDNPNWRSSSSYSQDRYDERQYRRNDNPNWRSPSDYRQGRSFYSPQNSPMRQQRNYSPRFSPKGGDRGKYATFSSQSQDYSNRKRPESRTNADSSWRSPTLSPDRHPEQKGFHSPPPATYQQDKKNPQTKGPMDKPQVKFSPHLNY